MARYRQAGAACRLLGRGALLALFLLLGSGSGLLRADGMAIRPYPDNPFYWSYRGDPVLLLGASVVDNLLHWPDLEDHLDELQAIGVNYLRVTLSRGTRAIHGGPDRPLDHDQPFLRLPSGRYDLSQWDPVYWERFARLLELAHARGMIIELELFNRFDFVRSFWRSSAWHPFNNVNYSQAETGLARAYDEHPAEDRQPFFHSVPALGGNPRLLGFQEAFVDKVLDLTLRYDNILYCINNETTTDPAWGRFWMDHVRRRGRARGVEPFTTDMFDSHDLQTSPMHRQAFDAADSYGFLNISQNNSPRNPPETHWANLLAVRARLAGAPRPLNNSKIYGADSMTLSAFRRRNFHRHGDLAGINSFWMNLIGGSASLRFHRYDAGLGVSAASAAAIGAARKLETRIAIWTLEPRQDLLSGRDLIEIEASADGLDHPSIYGEAYLAADPGHAYALYFTRGGEVGLDLGAYPAAVFDLRWIDGDSGEWGPSGTVEGGGTARLDAPSHGTWIAALTRLAPNP